VDVVESPLVLLVLVLMELMLRELVELLVLDAMEPDLRTKQVECCAECVVLPMEEERFEAGVKGVVVGAAAVVVASKQVPTVTSQTQSQYQNIHSSLFRLSEYRVTLLIEGRGLWPFSIASICREANKLASKLPRSFQNSTQARPPFLSIFRQWSY